MRCVRDGAPHGFIVGELHLIDKAVPSTLIYAHGGLAILAELFESIPKRIHMARGILVKHAIVATSVKLAHARHGNLERVAALSRSLIYQLGNRNLAPNSMPGCTIVLAHQHVLIKPRIVVQIARATTNAVRGARAKRTEQPAVGNNTAVGHKRLLNLSEQLGKLPGMAPGHADGRQAGCGFCCCRGRARC